MCFIRFILCVCVRVVRRLAGEGPFCAVGCVCALPSCFLWRSDAEPRRTVNVMLMCVVQGLGGETHGEIKSDANERSSWFVVYFVCVSVCVRLAVARLCSVYRCTRIFLCICDGSRLAGTSLANCYRNNNISIRMYIRGAYRVRHSTQHTPSPPAWLPLARVIQSVTKGESILRRCRQRWLRWRYALACSNSFGCKQV